MLMESNQTSPWARSVAQRLAKNATRMPMLTGTSMPTRRSRRSRQAERRNGLAENSITGKVSIRPMMRISCTMSGVMSEAPSDKYTGRLSIITCIMEKPATNRRHSMARRWRRRLCSARPGSKGRAR